MPKYEKEQNVKTQLRRLLLISALSSFQLAGASWVALLAAREFSLVEIGIAESCFHIASLLFEIPSGVISDVFGRRKSMMMSQLLSMISALCMALTNDFAGVCAALVLNAWSYNFASGAREALAYDSLKAMNQQHCYMDYSTRELCLYRLGNAAAILCAGLALWMGYRAAYLLDMLLTLAGFYLACGLWETVDTRPVGRVWHRLASCFRQSLCFVVRNISCLMVMLAAALPSAVATLCVFFLQARLETAIFSPALLDPALFCVSLGGALGARCAKYFTKLCYCRACILCTAGIALSVRLCLSGSAVCMCVGGFVASLLSDVVELLSDTALNARFPSDQRGTLLSMASLVFSLVMIALSPLAGWIFQA